MIHYVRVLTDWSKVANTEPKDYEHGIHSWDNGSSEVACERFKVK